ncbi:cytochrome b/b6 domain-containing protein [Roseovarius sp. D0-M9]|uniref:cytochrome b/b6 domain-containing protein n=1 Tax=Roseovarius sp. D0-M9 TaxID=3127117 RepID=UPI0030102EBD
MSAKTIPTSTSPAGGDLVRRHRLSTRIWHWINAATLLVLLMSGLMIFNAHPRLYWGQYGANPDPAWLEIGSAGDQGYLRIGDVQIETTGVLGRWSDGSGRIQTRAFPSWSTIPSSYNLALARRWHLTFAWVLALGITCYAAWSLVNGHFRRDLLPKRRELRLAHIWREIRHHATLNFPKGAAAASYNVLQKLSYISVVVVAIPVVVLTGLTMSPSMVASWPWLLDVFGGRQSARSIHFIVAMFLVLFVIVHLVMVLLAGPFNEVRSMITGWFRLPKEKSE